LWERGEIQLEYITSKQRTVTTIITIIFIVTGLLGMLECVVKKPVRLGDTWTYTKSDSSMRSGMDVVTESTTTGTLLEETKYQDKNLNSRPNISSA